MQSAGVCTLGLRRGGEALFLGSTAELRVCESVQGSRYVYTITAGPLLDASLRLYFALHDGVLTETDSPALNKTIRRFPGAAAVVC